MVRYTREEWRILKVLKHRDIETEKRINSKAKRSRVKRIHVRCSKCGKFINVNDDGSKHKSNCKLIRCKRCGEFIGEMEHVCRV